MLGSSCSLNHPMNLTSRETNKKPELSSLSVMVDSSHWSLQITLYPSPLCSVPPKNKCYGTTMGFLAFSGFWLGFANEGPQQLIRKKGHCEDCSSGYLLVGTCVSLLKTQPLTYASISLTSLTSVASL